MFKGRGIGPSLARSFFREQERGGARRDQWNLEVMVPRNDLSI